MNNDMIKLNEVRNENCLDTMKLMEDNFIDLTVTSPPYDNLRTYNGYSFDFESIAKELYRVTKEGGVVVWVVGDATVKGCETNTSFKQALFFKECGFNLHDTMIYHKEAVGACGSKNGYNQSFEYMFVFTKGKLKTFNPIKDLIPKNAGKPTRYAKTKSSKKGYNLDAHIKIAPKSSKRQNVWTYKIGFSSRNDRNKHPAIFPEKLANDHIISWSNEGDLVYDPFMGSGTTAKMSVTNNRYWLGSDTSVEYCDITKERINSFKEHLRNI